MPNRTAMDPYAVLGVPRDASPLQVARARRRLAKQFHPDLHPDQEVSAAMRRVNEAWFILSSAVRRAEYDRAHPSAGTPLSGHWAASRPEFRPRQPTTTRTWATWRTSAEEVRAAPRTRRQPDETPVVSTRRPPPMAPVERRWQDSGWAAILAGIVMLLVLVAAIVAGRLT
jgi:hypothetical protein